MTTRYIHQSSSRKTQAAYAGGLLMVAIAAAGGSKLEAARGEFPSIIAFEEAAAEFPEGVAVDKPGNVYVSFGAGRSTHAGIWKFTPSGEQSLLTDFGSEAAFGLAIDAVGNVYVGRFGGVDRVDSAGYVSRLPGTQQIVLANSLAFDKQGNLYVTESFSFDPPLVDYPNCGQIGRGGVWRIPRGGPAELWLRDDLLTGLCSIPGLPIPVGANGIAYWHGQVFVVNSELGVIVKIPVLKHGKPGTPEIAAVIPEPFPAATPPGGDGLALDVHGNFYVPMPSHSVVVRISADGQSWEPIATPADGLDVPASVAFGTGKGERENLFITNLALFPGGAGPSLVKVDAGIPGLPLP